MLAFILNNFRLKEMFNNSVNNRKAMVDMIQNSSYNDPINMFDLYGTEEITKMVCLA